MTSRRVLVEVPEILTLRERIAFASDIEARGFDGVTLAEISDPDAFVALGLMAAQTERITLDTCVVQLGVRTVPALAASSATVQDISDGRFRLGFGVSSEVIVSGWHGRSWQPPLANARESIELLRLILAGEKSRFDGQTVHSKGFQLNNAPTVPVPLHLAALNSRMIELGAELADGLWFNYLPVHRAAAVCDLVDATAAKAGRPPARKLLTAFAEVTDDLADTRAYLRELLAFYMTVPSYRKALSSHGFAEEMEDARIAFEKRDRAGVMVAITDRLIDSITAIGTPTQVRDRMEEYFAAGIDELQISPLRPESIDTTLKAAVGASS